MNEINTRKTILYIFTSITVGMGIFFAVLAGFSHNYAPKSSAVSPKAEPKVLGALTNLRGEQVTERSVFTLKKDFNESRITAKSYLVFDLANGATILEKNAKARLPIASLTKLITGLVAYDNLDFSSHMQVKPGDIFEISPVLGLKAGDVVKVNDVFDSMIIGSANDAAIFLANRTQETTGRNFAELMNKKALDLNMPDTKFSNPLGFDSRANYSTASDLASAVRAAQKLTVFTNLGRRTSHSFFGEFGAYQIFSTNKLLTGHPEIEAIKTGYTESSKGSIVSKIRLKGMQVAFIILGSENREKDLVELKSFVLNSVIVQE